MKKINNKGFSLVELMVVIGIMAIVASIFTYGFSLISDKQVDQCAKKIQMALENAKANENRYYSNRIIKIILVV